MHIVLWFLLLFQRRHFYRYQGLSFSCVRDSHLERQNEVLWDLYSFPVFPMLWVFWFYPLCLIIWISLFWQTSFPFLQAFLLLLLLQTDHRSYLNATFQLTSCLKKTIKTSFPTLSYHLVACNTQGLLFQKSLWVTATHSFLEGSRLD